MDDRDSIPRRGKDRSVHHQTKTGSEVHSASYPMGTEESFPGVKRPGNEASHSSPYSEEGKNTYTSTLPYVFMAWCLIQYRGNETNI
jgi:hypothetical protein